MLNRYSSGDELFSFVLKISKKLSPGIIKCSKMYELLSMLSDGIQKLFEDVVSIQYVAS